MMDYNWIGYGLVLTNGKGEEVFLQDEDASYLYDMLEEISDENILESVISEYFAN